MDTNPRLFFHLQQQRLIELIRDGKIDEAIEFAQEELAPRGEENVTSDNPNVYFNVAKPSFYLLARVSGRIGTDHGLTGIQY